MEIDSNKYSAIYKKLNTDPNSPPLSNCPIKMHHKLQNIESISMGRSN